MADPAPPEVTDRLRRGFGQRAPAPRGQLQPPTDDLGQATGLHQQRPRERGDRLLAVEVPAGEDAGDSGDGRGRGPLRLLTAPQPAGRAQLQDGEHIGGRLPRPRANGQLIRVQRHIRDCVHAHRYGHTR